MISEICYKGSRSGIVTKASGRWVVESMLNLMTESAKGEASLDFVWLNDAMVNDLLKPKRNFGGRFFQLEIPTEDCTIEDPIILIPEERDGEGW